VNPAEERTWEVVRVAFERRQPAPVQRRVRPALVLAAVATALVAAALSPPGMAVVNAVRRSVGIEHTQPALFRLPAPGRLLVSGAGGTWVVSADGSTRRLGPYAQASWSPHGLFVVASTPDVLTTLEPGGRVHWKLARPHIGLARWGGTRTDTRIAYLTTSTLRVVGGDGTGDVAEHGLPPAASIAPAWRPTAADEHVLAYVTAGGRVLVVGAGRGDVLWRSRAYAGPLALAWSPDGRTLALATRTEVVLFAGASGRARAVRLEGVRSLAFAPDGRLALLRGRSIIVGGRTLFVAPSTLAGLTWSPDGRWLLSSLPAADQWVFVQAAGGHRVLAVSHIRREFGREPTLDGWMP
jgi:hypothetical protein